MKYQPGFKISNPNQIDSASGDAQFGMMISLGGGVIALILGIWTFMVSDTDSDMTFLWLSVGSFVAVIGSIGLVEFQYRRKGSLSIIHDYILSFGLLFGALGTIWLSRFALYAMCVDAALTNGFCRGESGTPDWIPGEWGIVVQSTTMAIALLSFWLYTKRVNGGTVPRLVLVLAPLALIAYGSMPWVDYTADNSTLPLIIGVLTLSITSMGIATDSDRSPLFLTAAIVSSLVPFLYESSMVEGEGLSMLVMIVLVQGVFAAHPGLSREMIEKGSIALVALVIIAQWMAGATDADFIIIEPIVSDWISLPLVLWMSLLVGYFWPVLKNRVPSMPIGLGFGLLFIPGPGSMLAWCLALLAFIYMLTKPQTRRWVSDWTYAGMIFSWWANGWLANGGELTNLAMDPAFVAIPPIALTVIGLFAVRENKLKNSVHQVGIFAIITSHELLLGNGDILPWGVALFLLGLVAQQAYDARAILEAGEKARMEATGRVAMAVIGFMIMEIAGRLSITQLDSLTMIHVEAMMFAIILYVICRRLREVEVDIGKLFANLWYSGAGIPVYDYATNTWSNSSESKPEKIDEMSLGPAARIGLLAPLLIFSTSLSMAYIDLNIEMLHLLLLLIPIGVLTYEVLVELPNDDRTRATAAWALVLIGLPISWSIHSYETFTLETGLILFDAIMLSGPIAVDIALRKRGLSGEKNMQAGAATLVALLVIGLLDVSGGLLAIPMFALVLSRGYAHRQAIATRCLGFVWVLWVIMLDLDSSATLISYAPEIAYLQEISVVVPRWTGIGLLMIGAPSLYGRLSDTRAKKRGEEVDEFEHPLVFPSIFVLAGIFFLLPDSHWFLVFCVVLATGIAWAVGAYQWFYWAPLAMFISMVFATGIEWNQWSDGEVFEFSSVSAFIFTSALYILHTKKILFKNLTIEDSEENDISKLIQTVVDIIAIYSIVWAIFADTIFYGIAMFVGILIFTKYVHQRRWANLLLILPVVHAWVVFRVLDGPYPGLSTEIAGFIMLIESLALTWSSWNMWDFEWDEWSDEQVLEMSTTSGIAGALIFIPSAWLLVNDMGDLWLFGGMLCVHSAGQGAIGFQRDISWRRLYAMIGVSVGFLFIWGDIDSGIMKGVMLILAALTMFMLGILYMTRAGYEMEGTKVLNAASFSPISDEMEDDLGELPEPVLSKEIEEESEETIEQDEAEENDENAVSEEEVDGGEDEEVETLPEPVISEKYDTIISGDDYDVQLPADIQMNIMNAIASTPHEGFRAIVRWNAWGQVIVDWEPTEV